MKTVTWAIFACVASMNIVSPHARTEHNTVKKNHAAINGHKKPGFISMETQDLPSRRVFMEPDRVILGVPRRPEHLPKALPILPGHTLLRPSRGMLKSAVKYPMRDFGGSPVYGNEDNLGITWGKSGHRIRYTDFRKANDLLTASSYNLELTNKPAEKNRNRRLVIIELDPSTLETINEDYSTYFSEPQIAEEEENNANEVLDELDAWSYENDDSDETSFRRTRHKKKYRDRKKYYDKKSTSSKSSASSSSSSTSSSELEKNPGNPFTIHKNKYKQNWMWNHELDGDHMNINPYAPQLNVLGPSGADLLFGRKWWYFNQDDYKPMGRRRNLI